MKKTSRRSFGKQVSGAIAGIPFIALASESKATGQKTKGTKPSSSDNRAHQNTPPPISVDDGSLSIGVRLPAAQGLPPGQTTPLKETSLGSGRFQYQGNVNYQYDNTIEHIKVIHGSGNMVYTDLQAQGSIISVELKETSTVVGNLELKEVPGAPGPQSQLQISSVGKLDHQPPSLKGGRHRWGHKGGGTNDFFVSRIQITKNSQLQCDIKETEGQDYRILVWLKDEA